MKRTAFVITTIIILLFLALFFAVASRSYASVLNPNALQNPVFFSDTTEEDIRNVNTLSNNKDDKDKEIERNNGVTDNKGIQNAPITFVSPTNVSAVPVPSSIVLLLTAVLGLTLVRRNK